MGLFSKWNKKSGPDRVATSQITSVTNPRMTGSINGAFPNMPVTVHKPGNITDAQAVAIYTQSPLAFTATRIISGLLSTVPFNVYYMEDPRSNKKVIKRIGYPYKTLQWVNHAMTLSELVKHTASWLSITGDAYWAMEPTEPQFKNRSPLSIYPLNPIFLKIVPDPDTGVRSYVYDMGGKDRLFYEPQQVIHFRNFSPLGHWHGMSPYEPLSYDLQVEKYTKRQLRNYFSEGTVIDGVLTTEDSWDSDEIRKLKREFREQYAGARNAHRIIVLSKGMKYDIPQGPSPDSITPEILKLVADNHGMVFGVPVEVMLGKGADLDAAKLLMWEQTIMDIGQIISDVATKFLAQPIMDRLSVGFDYSNVNALRLHDLNRARVEVAHANTGIRTVDEIRAERNMDPLGTEFSGTPIPEWTMAQQIKLGRIGGGPGTGSSPSLPLTGSEGGRDQGTDGEAQMTDTTGKKELEEMFGKSTDVL